MIQRKANTSKRPYGISYDGKISTRLKAYLFSTRRNQAQAKEETSSVGLIKKQQKEDILLNSIPAKHQQDMVQNIMPKCNEESERILNICEPENSSQVQVQMDKYSRKFMRNLSSIIKQQKKIFYCKCGRRYTSRNFLIIHIKTKHNGQMQAMEQKNEPASKQRKLTKIDLNWQGRSVKCLKSLSITESQLLQEIKTLNQKQIKVNLLIEPERVFYLMFTSLHYSYSKFSILYLYDLLLQFLNQNPLCYKIWLFDFENFGLISHIFYQWVCKERYNQIENQSYKSFILESYLLFTQWCNFHGYMSTLVTKNQIVGR